MREWAEQEVIIPDGPFAGRKFRCSRQPYSGLVLDAIDSGLWNRFAFVGVVQSGKTLLGGVIPCLYHLFEIGETVIFGLPDMDMAADKWRQDLLPVIERSRYRDLLPRDGGGSKGGKVRAIQFRNGATLRFMSGGGGDKSRSAFTSRVLVVTEVDGMDQAGGGSREADKLSQMEARLMAYGSRKRVYLECSVSIEAGAIWQEYTGGTESVIACRCPHCTGYVNPERENLHGWREAETEVAARAAAQFHCPACGEGWDEDNRRAANEQAILVHRGQQVSAGQVVGDLPPTETLGVRWSAVNNMFRTAGDVGVDEWRGSRATDEDNAEKKLLQFGWARPYKQKDLENKPLEPDAISKRMAKAWPRGLVPVEAEYLTSTLDIGKYLCHWSTYAWLPDATPHVVDYGRIEVATDHLGEERAILTALRQFRDLVEAGWTSEGGALRIPDQAWIDSNYQTDLVYQFVRETARDADNRYRACVGRGAGQQRKLYVAPRDKNKTIRHIGEGYHVVKLADKGVYLFEVNADAWKTWLHARLATPAGSAGGMTLFQTLPREHLAFCKHLTAERPVDEFVPGKGLQRRWETIRRQNHWLDTGYLACAAGHFCGARLLPQPTKTTVPTPQARPVVTMPDGRPFLVTERQ